MGMIEQFYQSSGIETLGRIADALERIANALEAGVSEGVPVAEEMVSLDQAGTVNLLIETLEELGVPIRPSL